MYTVLYFTVLYCTSLFCTVYKDPSRMVESHATWWESLPITVHPPPPEPPQSVMLALNLACALAVISC
jgi:hypothetical protein